MEKLFSNPQAKARYNECSAKNAKFKETLILGANSAFAGSWEWPPPWIVCWGPH